MDTSRGLLARQALTLGSALLLTTATAAVALGQSEPAGSAGVPSRFQTATFPADEIGRSIHDVIPGGPGYIAVGGGSSTGLDLKAIVWTSVDGRTWEPGTLVGEAANGTITAASGRPGGGYVAVGYESMPDRGPDAGPVDGLAWTSVDGVSWERVDTGDAFVGSILYDVAATGDGIVAVGCRSATHCIEGRAWTSTDGLAWEPAPAPALIPFAVAAAGDATVAGGTDDAGGPGVGRAVVGGWSSDGFAVAPPLGRVVSGVTSLAASDEGFVGAGWQQPRNGNGPPESALYVSSDGAEWVSYTDRRLHGLRAPVVASHPDFVMIAGTVFDDEGDSIPKGVWTADLESYQQVRFPDDLEFDGLSIEGTGVAEDGSMIFAAGAEGYRPAIWYSVVE